MEGMDEDAVFKLTHANQPSIVFQADNSTLAQK